MRWLKENFLGTSQYGFAVIIEGHVNDEGSWKARLSQTMVIVHVIRCNSYLNHGGVVGWPLLNYELPQNIPQISTAIGKWIRGQCNEVFHKAQSAGSDIFGFGNYARWLAPDWDHWQKWDWNKSFKALKLDLAVKVHIDRTGLIFKKNAVRGD